MGNVVSLYRHKVGGYARLSERVVRERASEQAPVQRRNLVVSRGELLDNGTGEVFGPIVPKLPEGVVGTAQMYPDADGWWMLRVDIVGIDEPAICTLGTTDTTDAMVRANRIIYRGTEAVIDQWIATLSNLWSASLYYPHR